jgi:hypothetical protein
MPHNRKRILQVAAKGLFINEPYALVLVYIYLKGTAMDKKIPVRNIRSAYVVRAVDELKYTQLRC